MVQAGSKAKRFFSVNHTTKTIHDHHHRYVKNPLFIKLCSIPEHLGKSAFFGEKVLT